MNAIGNEFASIYQMHAGRVYRDKNGDTFRCRKSAADQKISVECLSSYASHRYPGHPYLVTNDFGPFVEISSSSGCPSAGSEAKAVMKTLPKIGKKYRSLNDIIFTVIGVSAINNEHLIIEHQDGKLSSISAEIPYEEYREPKKIERFALVFRHKTGEIFMDGNLFESDAKARETRSEIVAVIPVEYTEEV